MTTYQTPNPLRLRLKLEAGRIDIITWDEPRAEVEVTPLGDDQASIEAWSLPSGVTSTSERGSSQVMMSMRPASSFRRRRTGWGVW